MTINESIRAHGGVLVGHDGSASAKAALLTAIRCAPSFGGHVTVVRAWTLGTAPPLGVLEPGQLPTYEDFEKVVSAELENEIAPARSVDPQVHVAAQVVHGDPGEMLVEASRLVDMIVVGSRGHGRVKKILLGSVSDHLTHNAACPVLVDRGTSSHLVIHGPGC